MKRSGWIWMVGMGAVAAGASVFALKDTQEDVTWRTAKVDRGAITARVSATGTLNALIQVPVGTQVSGVVTGLYADFNSLVKKGQVIGRIDEVPWTTALSDAEAALRRAQASLLNAQADYKRNKELADQELLDASDLDAKLLALQTAQGNLVSARAALAGARTNLGYCTIKAPLDGVVVARFVDVGQTVAASFATPSMFTIAQDQNKMKVMAAIDEADIGQVKVGARAFFTVDSYPDKQFHGLVSEVQLNPIVNQNVVTYNVVMEVDNEPRTEPGERLPREGRKGGGGPAGDLEASTARYIPKGGQTYKGDLALFPGMTANCTIITQDVKQALRVPSSALRFNPAAFVRDADATRAPARAPGNARPGAGVAKGMVARREDKVWTLVGGKPKLLPVNAGASDGMFTEIAGEGVAEGMVVLTGVEELRKAQNAGATPLGGIRR